MVPQPDSEGEWTSEEPIPAPEDTGRAFARVTGDVNPIHMHALSARLFGFPRAIAHGWWTTGRSLAVLGVDESLPGRRLEIAFRRPVELPSTPLLCSRAGADGEISFGLFPTAPVPSGADPVRALVAGVVSG